MDHFVVRILDILFFILIELDFCNYMKINTMRLH